MVYRAGQCFYLSDPLRCIGLGPTYLKEVKGYDITEIGWAYFVYEFAAIPGTIVCGWLSDKLFKGRRALTTMIYMVLIAVSIFVYWQFSATPLMDSICLIAIGFLIYGPVMLIRVHALDLAPKRLPVRLPDYQVLRLFLWNGPVR